MNSQFTRLILSAHGRKTLTNRKRWITLSELQADKTQLSDLARALNSMMGNLENIVVNFEKTLSTMSEKIEKQRSLEKPSQGDKTPNDNELITEETTQLTDGATISTEIPPQKTSETHTTTEITTNTGTNPQSRNEIQESIPAMLGENGMSKRNIFSATVGKMIKKVSSKFDYCILAIALAILVIAIVKLYFMLLS